MNTNIAQSNVFVVIKTDDPRFNSVNARELHGALEVGKDFSTWIKGRIEQYGFVEGEDFVIGNSVYEGETAVADGVLLAKSGEQNGIDMNANGVANETLLPNFGEQNRLDMNDDSVANANSSTCAARVSSDGVYGQKDARGGSNRVDYIISVDMAKELAMIEANDIGRLVRRYFIAAEKELVKRMRDEYVADLTKKDALLADKDALLAKKDDEIARKDTCIAEITRRNGHLFNDLYAFEKDSEFVKNETKAARINNRIRQANYALANSADELTNAVFEMRDVFVEYSAAVYRLAMLRSLRGQSLREATDACVNHGAVLTWKLNDVIEAIEKVPNRTIKITKDDRILVTPRDGD